MTALVQLLFAFLLLFFIYLFIFIFSLSAAGAGTEPPLATNQKERQRRFLISWINKLLISNSCCCSSCCCCSSVALCSFMVTCCRWLAYLAASDATTVQQREKRRTNANCTKYNIKITTTDHHQCVQRSRKEKIAVCQWGWGEVRGSTLMKVMSLTYFSQHHLSCRVVNPGGHTPRSDQNTDPVQHCGCDWLAGWIPSSRKGRRPAIIKY